MKRRRVRSGSQWSESSVPIPGEPRKEEDKAFHPQMGDRSMEGRVGAEGSGLRWIQE